MVSETRVWFILNMEVIKLGSFRVRPRRFVIGFNLKKDTVCHVTGVMMSSHLHTLSFRYIALLASQFVIKLYKVRFYPKTLKKRVCNRLRPENPPERNVNLLI